MHRPISSPLLYSIASCVALLIGLTGCNKAVDGSDAAATVTSKAFNDAKDTWTDLFTYRPKKKPQDPQTRYCYQLQSDIVCYDSLQPNSTSKLVGYQDGNKISWVQPGGGSLGASGGAPTGPNDRAAAFTPAFVNATAVEVPQPGTIQTHNLPPSTSH